MDCTRKIYAWMSFVLAACPLVALAQFEQGAGEPLPRDPQQQVAQPQQQPAQPQQQVAQPQQQPAQPQQQPELNVVVTVNGDPITREEVQATLQPQLQSRKVDPQTAQQMQKQVIDNLIEGRLVEQYVLETGPDVEQQEVKAAVDRLKEQLAAQNVSLDQFLVSRGQTPESFHDRIKGSLAWQKFQQQQLTDENLERYFRERQQQFNAESFEEARQEVSNAYVGQLWQQIISQMKPKAEIRVAPAAQPSPKPREPAPQRLP